MEEVRLNHLPQHTSSRCLFHQLFPQPLPALPAPWTTTGLPCHAALPRDTTTSQTERRKTPMPKPSQQSTFKDETRSQVAAQLNNFSKVQHFLFSLVLLEMIPRFTFRIQLNSCRPQDKSQGILLLFHLG